MERLEKQVSLEEKINYYFRDKGLLEEALTHKSFSNEQPGAIPFNERLEFLGDAVLDLVISRYVFKHLAAPEGELTRIRAEVVNEKSLSLIAGKLELGSYLRLGKGEELSGGRTKSSLLANVLEAILGAVFCDSDFENARSVAEPLFVAEIHRAASSKIGVDYKTRLQEMLQSLCGKTPEYVLTQVAGPEHCRSYSVEVRFDGKSIGGGTGTTKKKAEQGAAREALAFLEGEGR